MQILAAAWDFYMSSVTNRQAGNGRHLVKIIIDIISAILKIGMLFLDEEILTILYERVPDTMAESKAANYAILSNMKIIWKFLNELNLHRLFDTERAAYFEEACQF